MPLFTHYISKYLFIITLEEDNILIELYFN